MAMRSSPTGRLSPNGQVLLQTAHSSSHLPHVDVDVTVSNSAKFSGKNSGGNSPCDEVLDTSHSSVTSR